MAKHRVMIVEDESLVAEDLHMCLEKFGYQVVGIADTAEAAVRLAHQESPQLALLDIRLKGARDGIDLASELRRERIGFVYLTSHADQATLSRAQATEPLGYVLKPFDAREVYPVLEMAFYRHAAELKLRTMERWFSTTLRSIGDAIAVTDIDRRVTYLNPVAERLTGWTLRDAVGQPVGELLRIVDEATKLPVPCIVTRSLAEQATVYLDPGSEIVTKDGRRLPVDDCASPVRDEDGTVTGSVVVLRDATATRAVLAKQREVDRRMEDARRMQSLGVLAGGLAHDLNNALTAILGNCSLCREDAPIVMHASLDEIEGNARSAAALCRQMLLGAGTGTLQVQAVELLPVLAECLQRERALASPRVRFELGEEDRPTVVAADPVQLRQVVANLLRNAVEAMAGRDGNIVVRSGHVHLPDPGLSRQEVVQHLPAGEYVWFEVADDGPGMPEDVRSRIFEPFFSTKFTGRGLGLASVHGIVAHHAGVIQVLSQVGQGTLFRVYWPTPSLSAGAPAGHPNARARPAGPRTIAVVDDDAAVRKVTAELLRGKGAICLELAGGNELLAVLRRGVHLDGVVLDAMMPEVTGQEALTELRRTWPDLPVVMVSGHIDLSELLLLHDQFLDYLAKPFDADDLLARLERLMRSSAGG